MNLDRVIADREVEANRLELLEKLRVNRAAHVAAFEEAKVAYPQAVHNAIADWKATVAALNVTDPEMKPAAAIKRTQKVARALDLPEEPVSFAHIYDEMIELLEVEVNETVMFSGRMIRALVYDKWDWKDHAAAMYAKVVRTAAL